MDEKHRVAALLDGRLSGPDRDAAVSAIVASNDDQALLRGTQPRCSAIWNLNRTKGGRGCVTR